MESDMLWSFVLTTLVTIIGWIAGVARMELQRVQILLNRTREEVARDYQTKREASADMRRVFEQLERLDEKLDRMLERQDEKLDRILERRVA